MNQEYADIVSKAAFIVTSGKSAALDAKVQRLFRDRGEYEAWWVHVFGRLFQEILSEYECLKTAYDQGEPCDAPLLAWRVRNLLELRVWAIYCAARKENARRLYNDAARDHRQLQNFALSWGNKIGRPTEWIKQVTNIKNEFSQAAASQGIESLDEPYYEVQKAATECGIWTESEFHWRILSKVLHPTALRIVFPLNSHADWYFANGCYYFIHGFEAVEGQLNPPLSD
jgi:hypothetical protein